MDKHSISDKGDKQYRSRRIVNAQFMDELKEKLLSAMNNDKKYRDHGCTAKRLAEELGVKTRNISTVVSQSFHTNFAQFVNSFRIEEAKELLDRQDDASLSMADISSMVGFGNRQSFYASFSRFTGMTPRAYRLAHAKDQTNPAANKD